MTPWTPEELLELEALEPGVVTPREWARALAGSSAPDDDDVDAGDELQDASASARPRRQYTSPHEGMRRAVDPAYAEQLFKLSPDVAHAVVPVQRVLGLLRRALNRVPEVKVRLRCEPPPVSFALAHGALAVAMGAPIALRGGCDLARGYGARGSEFPQLGALLRGRGSYSDTSCARVFRTWEEDGTGYRKQRLEPVPITCPRTGKTHPQRFGRNDVYLSRETLQTSAQEDWLRPLVAELRRLAPRWLYKATKAVRRWRKGLLSFVELVALNYEQRRQLIEARKRARHKLKHYRARAKKKAEQRRRLKRTVRDVPITPAFSPSEKRKSPADAGRKVGPTGPHPSGEAPAGRPPSPMTAAAAEPGAPREPWRPPREDLEPVRPARVLRSAGQGRGSGKPWERYLDGGPPTPLPAAPTHEITPPHGPPRTLSERARQARDKLRALLLGEAKP